MGKVIQFPNMPSDRARIERLEARLHELETENTWVKADMENLSGLLEGNIREMQVILRDLAKLHKLEPEPEIEFTNEWGDDFEFVPDFNLDDNPEDD